MEKAIKKLKELLLWSDRLGSDEIFEINDILTLLENETKT